MSMQYYIPLENGNRIILGEAKSFTTIEPFIYGTLFVSELFPTLADKGTLIYTYANGTKMYYKSVIHLKTGYNILCCSLLETDNDWYPKILAFTNSNDTIVTFKQIDVNSSDETPFTMLTWSTLSTIDEYCFVHITGRTPTPETFFRVNNSIDWCGITYKIGSTRYIDKLSNKYATLTTVASANAYHIFWDDNTPPQFDPSNPLESGGISQSGGGNGSFDLTSDSVDFQSPPSLSAVSAGFISLYAPTLAQLNSLASYMWSQTFIDAILKLFSDPMQAILGLSIVPVSVPVGAAENIKVGFVDTGVSCNKALSQYVTFDCGTLTPAEYWGSALDYSPYTKFTIFLPFIGAREIDTIDIMGKSIQVKYNIDILSGSCTAMIKCGDAVKYQYSGSCASSIPVTGRDFTNLLTSAIQLASIAGTTVATGGASAAGLVSATANAVAAMRPNVQRGSAVSGSAGLLGIQKPYLIWELPRQSLAKDYNKFLGYPSNITALLSSLSGFTQVEDIRLTSISATDDEKAEIETLLKEGVIL